MIAVFGATAQEIAGLLKWINLKKVSDPADRRAIYEGNIYDKEIILVRTGAGNRNARNAVKNLLYKNKDMPDMIFSIGWAGGVKEEVKYGDIVIADRIYSGCYRPVICSDQKLCDIATRVLEERKIRFHIGGSLTVPRPFLLPQEKRGVGNHRPVMMVEMESYEIAWAAAQKKIPCLTIRVITDAVDTTANFGPPQTQHPQEALDTSLLFFLKAV